MIHYEENLFLLNDMLRTLRKGCSINIDSSIFLEYVVNQVLFINKALKDLYTSITEASMLKQPENLKEMIRVTGFFTDLIDELTTGKLPFSEHIMTYKNDFMTISADYRKASSSLEESLAELQESGENEELVSQEEFMYLFNSEEENS